MADKTKIEWTHQRDAEGNVIREGATWNAIRGCSRVSQGCTNCYAERVAHRYGTEPGTPYYGLTVLQPNGKPRWNGEIMLVEKHLMDPLRWKKPRMIFVNSMSDLFHEGIPDEYIDKVFAVMALSTQHVFQVLTKRPERMMQYMADERTPYRISREIDALTVRAEMSKVSEKTIPISEYPGYLISNTGTVYTESGSTICYLCGTEIKDGLATKTYCSKKCRQNGGYHRKVGKPLPFEGKGGPRPMAPAVGEQGHQRVMLYRDGIQFRELVHRLVLTAFHREPKEGEQGCHLDGDPANNHIANLSWGSQSDNWADRKRHGNYRSYQKLDRMQASQIKSRLADGAKPEELASLYGVSSTQIYNILNGEQWAVEPVIEWPIPGVWLGVSVEDQKTADERIPLLLETPAAVRWISAEPLLGPVDLTDISAPTGEQWNALDNVEARDAAEEGACSTVLDWVIVGGESGPGARPMHPDWARSLRDQCIAAHVPFFYKQWGEWGPVERYPTAYVAEGSRQIMLHRSGENRYFLNDDGTPAEGVEVLGLVGKKRSGRLLDGVEWNQYPTTAPHV